MSPIKRGSRRLRLAMASAGIGLLFCLALLVRETPYTLVAFMFLGQPFLGLAALVFAWEVILDLRRGQVL